MADVQDPTASTESNASALLVTAYVMLVLSWISVSLRSYARAVLTKGFLADDWLMLASQVGYSGALRPTFVSIMLSGACSHHLLRF